jgi:hypothetical protein
LKVAARRAVLRADAAAAAQQLAAQRLAAAIRDRSVRMFSGEDGMGSLTATWALPVTAACRRALEAYAEDCRTPDDERTKDQRMADCLADLILRPGINGPVQIGLTMVAGVDTLAGGDAPGEVDGRPVSAVEVRELAYALDLLPRPDDTDKTANQVASEPAAEPDTGARVAEPAPEIPTGDRSLSLDEAATAGIGDLLDLRTVAGTALAYLPQIAVVDEISGQLLALTDATGIRHAATCGHPTCRTGKRPCPHPPHGPGLGPPPAGPGYSPSDPLARFVRARDRRCRFPGCRAAAIRCDAHHTTRWPDGPTSATNLCTLCRHHHRLIHQAPGWTLTALPDDGLQWTTPGGDTLITHPPRYGTDDDLPPPAPPAQEAHAAETADAKHRIGILEQLRRWPGRPPDSDHDAAPF